MYRNIFCFLKTILITLLLSVSASNIYGQSQSDLELYRKAKASGLSDEDIKKEFSKGTSGIPVTTQSTQYNVDLKRNNEVENERLEKIKQELIKHENERIITIADSLKSNTVFGREIFSSKNLSFEPNYNISTPTGYILGTGDEVLINIWGAASQDHRIMISPDGIINIPEVGPVNIGGLTVAQAENKIRNQMSSKFASLYDEENPTRMRLSVNKIRTIKINIAGEVVIPGTYTLPSLATLFNAIYVAGGVNQIGSLRNIKVYRDNKEIAKLDVYNYILNGLYDSNVRLEDNDMIIVSPYENLVTITGKTKRNRIFEMRNGEKISDLLTFAGGFAPEAYSENIELSRRNGKKYQIFTVEKDNFPSFAINNGDSINIGAISKMYENRIRVEGAVWRPGNYELSDKIRTVKDLIAISDGVKGDAFMPRAQITRLKDDYTFEIISIDIEKLLNGEIPDVTLKAEDVLFVPSIYDIKENTYIIVKGEVNKNVYNVINKHITSSIGRNKRTTEKNQSNNNTGLDSGINSDVYYLQKDNNNAITKDARKVYSSSDTIPFKHNMTIEDAILLAGGLKESASEAKIIVSRRIKDPKSMLSNSRTAEEFSFSISENLRISSEASNFILKPFDEVFVFPSPGYKTQQFVGIDGEVLFEGEFVISNREERISDIIKKAGGLTDAAYIKGASLKRKRTSDEISQEEALKKIARQQSSNGDTISVNVAPVLYSYVGINLVKALQNPGSIHDIVVKNGDIITIPQIENTVRIAGAVTYPNKTTFNPKAKLKSYIYQAGGYSTVARKRPFVIYMNGQVATTKSGLFSKRYPKIEPGAQIIVPQKSLNKNKMNVAEILGLLTSTVSMAAMVTSIAK